MSISETPPKRITISTPKTISDELLGGTISFCEETGYKQNVIIITFLWLGFLLSSKSQLSEDKLVEKVLNCYMASLSSLFPKLEEDTNFKKQVEEMLQHYWNNLNNDFNEFDKEEEIRAFLQIATKLNSQDDASSSYMLVKDPKESFKSIATNLHSSVYRILHQIDNGLGIEYRGIIHNAYFQHHVPSARIEKRVNYNTGSNFSVPSQANKDSTPWGKIIAGILIFLGFIFFIMIIDDSNSTNKDSELERVREPRSGEIIIGSEYYNGSEVTITTSSGSSCVVKLKTSNDKTRLSFYVRSGDTVTVGVPDEYLYVYFACGDTWYGERHLFGEDTRYSMDDEIKDFVNYTWKYTLYPVNDGNFSETPIDPEDF